MQVRDQVGQPVSGATVQLRAAAQGASGASVITLDARDGAYKGITQLTQQGQWSFDVRVQQPGKPDEQATFSLSLPLPGAQERLAKAQEAMNKVTSMKEQQVLRGSAGSAVTYDYRYNAPNAMAVSANDGSDVVIIDRKSTRLNSSHT